MTSRFSSTKPRSGGLLSYLGEGTECSAREGVACFCVVNLDWSKRRGWEQKGWVKNAKNSSALPRQSFMVWARYVFGSIMNSWIIRHSHVPMSNENDFYIVLHLGPRWLRLPAAGRKFRHPAWAPWFTWKRLLVSLASTPLSLSTVGKYKQEAFGCYQAQGILLQFSGCGS